jgi:hypothetical protein
VEASFQWVYFRGYLFWAGGIFVKLTETKVKKTKVGRLPDGRGLYLLVTDAGGKLWRAKYRFGDKEKLISYGKYPGVSLASAREKHGVTLKQLAEGVDLWPSGRLRSTQRRTSSGMSLKTGTRIGRRVRPNAIQITCSAF